MSDPNVLFVVACVLALVVYEVVAAISHKLWAFDWPTISQMVWRLTPNMTRRQRWIAFLLFAGGGGVLLGGHFFFDWLR